VGKTISRLEGGLGVRLFHRSTLAITLTPEGELFLESCRRIFSEINKIELEFSQSKATPKGRFKVSLPDVGTLMMPTLHGFMREYPEIQIDAEFTDNMVDVIDGGYDAVIRSGEQTDSRLMSKRLGNYRLEVVGSPSYFARRGRRSSAYWPPGRDYAYNDRPSMARRSDLIGGRCLKWQIRVSARCWRKARA
jgi:DNA-binding transcriptional LysR family regulator